MLYNSNRLCPAAGVQAELILGLLERRQKRSTADRASGYLAQRVHYEGEERLMDEEGRGVMMAWEGPLMEAHAKVRQSCSQCAAVGTSSSKRRPQGVAVGSNSWRPCRGRAWPHALLGEWPGPMHCLVVNKTCFPVPDHRGPILDVHATLRAACSRRASTVGAARKRLHGGFHGGACQVESSLHVRPALALPQLLLEAQRQIKGIVSCIALWSQSCASLLWSLPGPLMEAPAEGRVCCSRRPLILRPRQWVGKPGGPC